jgi:hypothetical protein
MAITGNKTRKTKMQEFISAFAKLANIKTALRLFEGISVTISAFCLYIATFVKAAFNDIETIWIKLPTALFIFMASLLMFARFRKVWKQGTSIQQNNKKNEDS